jgi:hypothetical protein
MGKGQDISNIFKSMSSWQEKKSLITVTSARELAHYFENCKLRARSFDLAFPV